MPQELIMFLIAVPAALLACLVANKYERSQRAWFKKILDASDEELAARPIRILTRDYHAMSGIHARLQRGSVTGSGITKAIAGEQRARLSNALEVAARASFGDKPGEAQRTLGPDNTDLTLSPPSPAEPRRTAI